MNILNAILSKIIPSSAEKGIPPSLAARTDQELGGGIATASIPHAQVDVDKILNEMAKKNPSDLNWRNSIVDLLKLLDLESSQAARKQLAKELNYSGDMNDSAAMNVWLHQQVMQKVEENGGQVPENLKH